MAVITLVVAGAYLWGTDMALNGGERYHLEWEGVRHSNSVRAVLIHLFPLPSGAHTQPAGLGRLLQVGPSPRPGVASGPTPEQRAAYAHSLREISAVEGATYLWERGMWALCALMAAIALLSFLVPSWGRFLHLLAAIAIIATTFFSLACLRYLEIPDDRGQSLWPLSPETYAALTQKWNIPDGGGMPPLLPRTYLALATLLSAYGWLLVAVFARRCRPTDQHTAQDSSHGTET